MPIWNDSSGRLDLLLNHEQIESVAQSGDNEPAVRALLETDEVASQVAEWPPEDLRDHLREYGAWDDDELDDDAMNRVRALWLAAWDLHEEAFLAA